jgi:hypothetical protein
MQGAAQQFASRPRSLGILAGGRDVDSAWEQYKLEAGKMLENGADSRRPLHAVLGGHGKEPKYYSITHNNPSSSFDFRKSRMVS